MEAMWDLAFPELVFNHKKIGQTFHEWLRHSKSKANKEC
jgi:hypothetical protein